MSKNIAIVPARGGSKRLPKKNTKLLYGKPLIQYSINAVVNSGIFDTVILSSDSDDILKCGSEIPGVTLEKRQDKFAGDKSKVIDLIKAIADRPEVYNNFDKIGLFLPTCPFRTATHIKEGYELLTAEDYSVVSVCEMNDPVQLSLTIDEKNIMNPEALISPSPLVTGATRSQDFDTYYRVNGGFYISWIKKFREKDNFFQGQVKSYVMPKLNSVDIDYELDFEWAEYLLKNKYVELN